MAELLLEILSEEIPPSMQRNGADLLAGKIEERLSQQNKHEEIKVEYYYSARRITVFIRNTSPLTRKELIRGPKLGAPEASLKGFAKKMMTDVEKLEIKTDENGEKFYYATPSSENIRNTIKTTIERCLQTMHWPKIMQWDETKTEWVRPIRNILCTLDGKVLPVQFGKVTASNTTTGHRLDSTKPFAVKSVSEYIKALKKHHVLINPEERRETVLKQLMDYAHNLQPDNVDAALGIAEWPNVIACDISTEFMSLPKKLIKIALESCDGVITATNSGNISKKFFVVTNNPKTNDNIVSGYERAVNTKLADLAILWNTDMARAKESLQSKCKNMVYHDKLGTYNDKTMRITELSQHIAMLIPYASIAETGRIAAISKYDISMSIVREYPELHGIAMARYLSDNNEEGGDILEKYNQLINFGDPSHIEYNGNAVAIALADMIDSILGLFATGNIPTTSRDPLRMKKTVDAIIKIILSYKLEKLHIFMILTKNVTSYRHIKKLFIPGNRSASEERPNNKRGITLNVLEFFMERFQLMLHEQFAISKAVCSAVFTTYIPSKPVTIMKNDDLALKKRQAQSIQNFINSPSGKSFLSSYKRASNITKKAESKALKVSPGLFATAQEKALHHGIKIVSLNINDAMRKKNFTEALKNLDTLYDKLDDFLDNTMVNDDSPGIRNNRLALLNMFLHCADAICQFEKLLN